jgi:transcriptional regulator with PAS, ATPase and Fis domain
MHIVTLPDTPLLATSIRATAQVFEDPRSRELLARLEQIAPSDASVLVIGATGTGKELVARHVHQLSGRRQGPFVAVNCGAFAENLVEAELFGHEKGAFTGALTTKAGWFEEAHGGTLFLDEIGDLSMAIQVKLLRVLQEREIVRVGSRKSIAVDVRIVAATNVALEKAVAAGRFRADLYYRINVARLDLPPLHARPGDILPLARHFVARHGRRLGARHIELELQAQQKLLRYSWPGNIRELENAIHHALLVCRDQRIREGDLQLSELPAAFDDSPTRASVAFAASHNADALLQRAFDQLFQEQPEGLHQHIADALVQAAYRYCQHNQVHTAELLGLSRNITRAHLIRIGALVVNKRRAPLLDHENPPLTHFSI